MGTSGSATRHGCHAPTATERGAAVAERNPACTVTHEGPCPEPYQLWAQAQQAQRDEYQRLMVAHGHLIPGKREPGEDIFGHRRRA